MRKIRLFFAYVVVPVYMVLFCSYFLFLRGRYTERFDDNTELVLLVFTPLVAMVGGVIVLVDLDRLRQQQRLPQTQAVREPPLPAPPSYPPPPLPPEPEPEPAPTNPLDFGGVFVDGVLATDNCAICLGSLTAEPSVQMRCTHQYHHRCLQQWFARKTTCPLCGCVFTVARAATPPR